MTVAELMEALSFLPAEARICLYAEDAGLVLASHVNMAQIGRITLEDAKFRTCNHSDLVVISESEFDLNRRYWVDLGEFNYS